MRYSLKPVALLFSFVSAIAAVPNRALSQQIKAVYLTKGDTTRNMYLLVSPGDSVKTTAFAFMIPGSFEGPADVLTQTSLPLLAARSGILTFIPICETGITGFAIDDSTQQSLKSIIAYCVQDYHLEHLKFYIGGFSTGGTAAIKYAELAVKDDYPVKPAAVFAIDPPLDYERFYDAACRNLRLMKGIYQNPELTYMIKEIETKMGGTPQTDRAQYYKYSPYSYTDTTQSAVRLLKSTPLSIYLEPDIEWWLQNRAFDYSDINAIDDAAMINELHLLGNREARLIATHNKGYRMPQKIRHPHSWSVLDPKDLLHWFQTLEGTQN